jgi:hypothetical protein
MNNTDKTYKIQTIGSMAKEELLQNIESNVLPNTFVIENREPFPGYHGKNLPTEPIPDSIFFITQTVYTYEKILRLGQKIRKFMNLYFDACYAKICVFNDTYHAIRIRDIDNYTVIQEIQQYFLDEGVKYKKNKKIETHGIIQLRKHFDIKYIGDNIYTDNRDDSMYYLAIPYQLSWSLFRDVTKKIKNNIDNSNFDAALGSFYFRDIVEFIRIYAKNLDMERLMIIRNKYIDALEKYF